MSCVCGKSVLISKYDLGSKCKECGYVIQPEVISNTTVYISKTLVSEQRLYIEIDGKKYDFKTGEKI